MSLQERRRTAAHNLREYFDNMTIRHIGCVNLNTGNSLTHELMKAETAYNLKSEGNIIATELTTKKGKRCDIVVLDVTPPMVYEIVHTETTESMRKKIKDYLPLRIHFVPTREPLKEAIRQ